MRFRLTSFHNKSAFPATAHSENSESGRSSFFIQFFVWFHIVCDRYASYHAHFTLFNLIWPLSLSWVFEIQTNGYTEKLSYLLILLDLTLAEPNLAWGRKQCLVAAAQRCKKPFGKAQTQIWPKKIAQKMCKWPHNQICNKTVYVTNKTIETLWIKVESHKIS